MNRTLAPFVAALLVMTGSAASAFEQTKSDSGAPEHFAFHWIGVNARALTDPERAAVMRAAATWSAVSCAQLHFIDVVTAPKESAQIVIKRGPLTNATFAAHTDVSTSPTGSILIAVITLDETRKFTTTDDVAPDAFDLETVVLHELGHALGLAHPIALNVPRRVVMKAGTKPGTKLRKLDDDDVAGVCAIYSSSATMR